MDRRVRRSVATLASLALATVSIACGSVVPEEKVVRDFFRASRLRDNAALGTFAIATFDASTDGQVQNLKIVSVSDERNTPYPIKEYSKAFDDAKASEEAFSKEKMVYQRANIDAIQRVVEAEGRNKPPAKKDLPIQTTWSKWRDDAIKHSKEVSDARIQLSRFKGLAELSLSTMNGPTPDVLNFDGKIVEKNVTVDATVRTPDGQTVQKTIVVTLERCVGKDATGKDTTGRWIVTHVKAPGQQKTT